MKTIKRFEFDNASPDACLELLRASGKTCEVGGSVYVITDAKGDVGPDGSMRGSFALSVPEFTQHDFLDSDGRIHSVPFYNDFNLDALKAKVGAREVESDAG